jgi:Gas vesicle protein
LSADDRAADAEELVLSDLLNRVLDRGVVIAGEITISVANIDLIRVGLNVYIAAIETELQKSAERDRSRPPLFNDAHLPVLRPPGHG